MAFLPHLDCVLLMVLTAPTRSTATSEWPPFFVAVIGLVRKADGLAAAAEPNPEGDGGRLPCQ